MQRGDGHYTDVITAEKKPKPILRVWRKDGRYYK
jgi:hypothetical protein